jgi:hypothetical protein
MELLGRLRHPAVVQLFGACAHEGDYFMVCRPRPLHPLPAVAAGLTAARGACKVLEYMAGGDLFSLLHDDDQPLSWRRRVRLLRDVATGLAFLHQNRVIHRDIKVSAGGACRPLAPLQLASGLGTRRRATCAEPERAAGRGDARAQDRRLRPGAGAYRERGHHGQRGHGHIPLDGARVSGRRCVARLRCAAGGGS